MYRSTCIPIEILTSNDIEVKNMWKITSIQKLIADHEGDLFFS